MAQNEQMESKMATSWAQIKAEISSGLNIAAKMASTQTNGILPNSTSQKQKFKLCTSSADQTPMSTPDSSPHQKSMKLPTTGLPSVFSLSTAPPADQFVEPILQEDPGRFTMFPIRKQQIFDLYKKAVSVFWPVEDVDLSKDMKDWERLNSNEQHFIKCVLGFFAGSDGIVQENLALRFMREIQLPEARAFYSCQNMMESIHSEMYSLLIDTYIQDRDEKHRILDSIHTIPCVAKKAEWARRWIEGESESFATRLVAFAAVEGIFFSGSFCAIFWLKERGLMPGLTVSNELISRDEGLHTEFACALYNELDRKLPKTKVHKILRQAVKIEKEFILEALPCNLIGMNSALMSDYIEFVADRLSMQLGYGKIWEKANPFDFMERISLEGKDNFFEKRVTAYAKKGVGKTAEQMKFTVDADF
jgi:ribonucleotide reductase beta subunit family protein with ferritin-like domain